MAAESHPEARIEALTRPEAYGDDASARFGIEHIQTHISHLFLTRDRVYKLKKAVALPFVSFAERSERNADCLAEVLLNRRLAPDVYLGVAPVLEDGGPAHMGGIGETLTTPPGADRPAEHCVVMRRLAADRSALVLLQSGRLAPEHVDRLAARMAAFHRDHGLGRPAPWSETEWLARTEHPVKESFLLAHTAGGALIGPARLAALEASMAAFLRDRQALFVARRDEGRAVDGHGDLHLDAVFIETDDAEPIAIDCLEFDENLRRIDAAAELAFFVMDCAYRERVDLGERLLRHYAALSDDYGLYDVIDYHVLHRALVRGGVAALAASDEGIDAEQRRHARDSAVSHIGLMERWDSRPSAAVLVITCGLPGTGKSTLAAAAAERLGGVVVASDRVRKHQAGVAPTDHGHSAELYGADAGADVYTGLLERALPVIRSGRTAILDATYGREADRAAVQAFARAQGVAVWLLEARCGASLTLERLERRLADPERVSDAGPDVYRKLAGQFEAPTEWPEDDRIPIDMGRSRWRDELGDALVARKLCP